MATSRSTTRLKDAAHHGRHSFRVDTRGPGFTDITAEAVAWLRASGAGDGVLTLFITHTSASLTIQENADPDVLRDLTDALERMAPYDHPYRHGIEGPDDMPAHIKSMVTSTSLSVPVEGGRLMLGTWQGIFLVEHRARPHSRRVILDFLGSPGAG